MPITRAGPAFRFSQYSTLRSLLISMEKMMKMKRMKRKRMKRKKMRRKMRKIKMPTPWTRPWVTPSCLGSRSLASRLRNLA